MQKIRRLRTDFLVRCLLRQIYQIYDHGGISSGRSYSSDLLDSAIDIFPEYVLDPDKFRSSDVLAELKRRKDSKKKLVRVFFGGPLESWNSFSIIFLLLKNLVDWTEKRYMEQLGKEKETQDYLVSQAERELLAAAIGMFSFDQKSLPEISVKDLTEESYQRWAIERRKKQKKELGY